MSLVDLRNAIDNEVSAILAGDFNIEVTTTRTVPHSNDAAITYPNLDTKTQKTKVINTCVLYIDIRRSTDLNLTRKPKTVSKLYSVFVRAMTRIARYHQGHVRGIIGDRVMVIFDSADAFAQAMNCAVTMNTVCKYVINRHFKANDFACGIGIDSGKMLATKTGIRRNGVDSGSYRNLVWLGRPANIASKLTDIAAKPAETIRIREVRVAYPKYRGFATNLGGTPGMDWEWKTVSAAEFAVMVDIAYAPTRVIFKDPAVQSFFVADRDLEIRPRTAPILMTEKVWNGFKAACPRDESVVHGWFSAIQIDVPNYTGRVVGGDVNYRALQPQL